jgi:anti-sigma factor RsiW
MTIHVPDSILRDYVRDLLDSDASRLVDQHLAACVACARSSAREATLLCVACELASVDISRAEGTKAKVASVDRRGDRTIAWSATSRMSGAIVLRAISLATELAGVRVGVTYGSVERWFVLTPTREGHAVTGTVSLA